MSRPLCIALAAMCLSAPAFGQISAEAKQHFQAGVELLKDPDGARYQEAHIQFKLAYEKSKSWKVLGNLALCEMKLERDGEAIEHYEQYLREGANDIDPGEREQVQKDVRVLKQGVGTVTLTTDAEGDVKVQDARVRTNGQTINTYDVKAKATLTVRAGNHAFKATFAGKTLEWTTDVTPGAKVEHAFKFKEPAPPPAASSGAPPATTAAPPASTAVEVKPQDASLRTYGYITAGVGGVLLIGGVVTGLMAKSKDSASKEGCIGTICPAKNKDDHDSAKSLAGMSTILFIGGGVAAAAGATLIVIGGPKDKAAARLQLTPAPGGLVARGAF